MTPNYYKPSNYINALGHVLAMLASLLVGALLAYAYGCIIIIIPSIYINALLCFGVSVVLAMLIRVFIRLFRLRNTKSVLALTILLPLVTYLFQWCVYIYFILFEGLPNPLDYLEAIHTITLTPSIFTNTLVELYTYGGWTVFGVQIFGFGIVAVWLIEFGLMMGIPLSVILRYDYYPFAERSKTWYPKYILHQDFESIPSSMGISQAMHENALKTISELKKGIGTRHTKVELYYHELEPVQYISLNKHTIGTNGRDHNKEYIVKNLAISTQMARDIMKQFPHKRERTHIF
jgi:hypothetical protein